MAALSLHARSAARRLCWTLARGLRRAAAAPLLAGAALLALPPAALCWRQAALAQQHAEATRVQRVPPPAPPRGQADEARLRLQAFHDALPAAERVPEVLQALLTLAEREGVQVLRGAYRMEHDPQGGFSRYRMSLPLRGEAQRVQGLIGAALQEFPTLAVEKIQYRRDAADARVLEAAVQWVLFVRTPAVAAPRSPA